MEGRDKILSTINQIKKSINLQADIFVNPGNPDYQTIYRKKCECRKVPPHILEKGGESRPSAASETANTLL